MNIYGVTVTYGNRYQFTEKLVKRLLELGVRKVVIVDNGSAVESSESLKLLAQEYRPKIELLSYSENLGSAGGFKNGLMFAHKQQDYDCIWTLDDDNYPATSALDELVSTYEKLNSNCCLVSLRKNRTPYRKIHNRVDVKRKFHPNNSFMNFNIFHGIRKKFLYDFRRQKSDLIPIPYGPYGGMFFHKKMLDLIGYPDERMFLYMDDHEFSHRIIRAGQQIYLDRKSIVEDLEVSWHGVKKYRFLKSFMLLIDGDELKSYHTMRNLIYVERKYFVTNNVQYAINRFLFKMIYYMLCYLQRKKEKVVLFERAVAGSDALELA